MKSENHLSRTYLERYSQVMLGIGVVVHLIFLLSLSFGFLNSSFDDSTHRIGQGADFYAVYQAGQNVVDGVSVYLREPKTVVVPYFFLYRYLPFSAYTFGQFFRAFSPPIAYSVWILLLEALLFFNLGLTRKIFSNTEKGQVAMSLWLLFSPYYLELYMGQFSFFMATLYLWMIYHWMKKKDVRGDALWTLSLLVKTNSALFAPVLLKMGKWKSVLVAAVIVVAVSVPYFLFMPGSFNSFAWNFTDGLSVETIAGNQGFASLLAVGVLRLSNQWAPNIDLFFQNIDTTNAVIRTPLILWTALIFGISLLVTIRTSVVYSSELFLLWILSYFLTYKHVWEHHYVMMLPVFILLYWKIAERQTPIIISSKLFWIAFIAIALPTPFIFIDKVRVWVDPEFYWSTAESIAFHIAKPAAVFALYSALCILLWKHGKNIPVAKSPEHSHTMVIESV